ncbi:MAG: DUF1015 family protein [Clostridiales Family XIII bacterium]|jgi:uncharacterized protein (DUF1015 family)|nr:DUF1015 family protein [Clostridiales Family XIII bacterium]
MATFRPFRAIRPKSEYAAEVLAPPYDVLDRDEAKAMAQGRPRSFLHVTRSEIDLPDSVGAYDGAVYERARDNLRGLLRDGVLVREPAPVFCVYRQSMGGRAQTGVVGCASIDEYRDGTIKRHELTRVEKEADRIRHFDACGADTEPVFLAFRDDAGLSSLIDGLTRARPPEFSFTAGDGVGHALWAVGDADAVEAISSAFGRIPALYIADGHHRSASAFKVGMKRREESPGYGGGEGFNFFMAAAFPGSELRIMEYNRLVSDLAGMTEEGFLDAISGAFDIGEAGAAACRPAEHEFGLLLGSGWRLLRAKPESVPEGDAIGSLDVSILQDRLLGPVLGIEDPRTDRRIDFVGGIRGPGELERRVGAGMAAAFALHPVSVARLMGIADMGLVMPPKSTWFEPKLGSGLFVHEL